MSDRKEEAQGAKILKTDNQEGYALRGTYPTSLVTEIDPEDVIGYDALWDSMEKCKRGVIWKGSVARFYLNAPTEIYRLSEELHNGTYIPHPPIEFQVTRPKLRDISSTAFRDRIVQRSLIDNAIYPCMSSRWIIDNYACQTGKGTDFARKRYTQHLQRFHRKYGINGYSLQSDIRKYYDNMYYDVIFSNFRKRCPDWVVDLIEYIVMYQYSNDEKAKGVKPGSPLIQIAGIDYLSDMDHYIKERLFIKYYSRYMDDFILINPDRDYLRYCMDEIADFLKPIGLELHPDKTHIKPITSRISFLGFNFRLLTSGKVVETVKKESVYNTKRRIKRMGRSGKVAEETLDGSYDGWRAHANKGDSYLLIRDMDNWYDSVKYEFYPDNV